MFQIVGEGNAVILPGFYVGNFIIGEQSLLRNNIFSSLTVHGTKSAMIS
jgi:hypothetical protein